MPNVLVCVKRVPGSSGHVILTVGRRRRWTPGTSGYTVSPHEECAVEAAVQLVSEHGGSADVLTLGPEDALEQLREALAMGISSAVHVQTEAERCCGSDAYGPADVAAAIVVGAPRRGPRRASRST